jgi:ribosomal-protein-alanine N-acetyltransferase
MSAAVNPRTEIRLMQPADLKAVASVEREAYQFPWSLGIFRDCLLAGYQCLVLDVGGAVMGYGIMSIAAGEAHLLNLCVHPQAQGLGYGRRLLNALLVRATDADAERVFLEVRPSNATALKLYASVGFERIGVRPSYYQALNGREDAVILSAALRPAR